MEENENLMNLSQTQTTSIVEHDLEIWISTR